MYVPAKKTICLFIYVFIAPLLLVFVIAFIFHRTYITSHDLTHIDITHIDRQTNIDIRIRRYIDRCIHRYIDRYTYAFVHGSMHHTTYIRIVTYGHIQSHTFTLTFTLTCIHLQLQAVTCIQTNIETYKHAIIHTCMGTCGCIHIYI